MCSYCGHRCRGRYDKQVCRVRDLSLAGWRIYLEYERWRVNCRGCGGVHVEHLDWLANNPRYTQRFATHVASCAGICRTRRWPRWNVCTTLRWKDLDKLYMQEQVERAGLPAPRAIGIDEISIRKGHNYRVIVSDLERARPIWVGGEGRKETDIDLFFKALGREEKRPYQAGRHGYVEALPELGWINNAPNARIIFDKFHIMRHLSKALDEVRRREYKRLSGEDRSYIKGQRYTLLSRRENLSLDGRRALKKLLQANRRLNTAYVLKEAFGQLWDYRTETRGSRLFTRWKDSLKWQRLHPYQKFAGMIESHWDGIASYCHPENKVSLGLVEGVNNKIRVLQRRAYGYRDEGYLKLKIVAAFLPPLPRNAVFNPHEPA